MEAMQVRIARPTNQLAAIKSFYTEGLGLKVIGEFTGHQGYDGVMIGLPDHQYHLEFTQFETPVDLPEPTKEHLLVFYFNDFEAFTKVNKRLQEMKFYPVSPENPYWEGKSLTYEDPDHWRIVLFNGLYK